MADTEFSNLKKHNKEKLKKCPECGCVWEIHHGEKIYNKVDMSEKELDEFIESLTSAQFERVTEFFDTMPKVQHAVEVTNPKTKKKGEVVIEGIQNFFE